MSVQDELKGRGTRQGKGIRPGSFVAGRLNKKSCNFLNTRVKDRTSQPEELL